VDNDRQAGCCDGTDEQWLRTKKLFVSIRIVYAAAKHFLIKLYLAQTEQKVANVFRNYKAAM
jgi:hypothetical protein